VEEARKGTRRILVGVPTSRAQSIAPVGTGAALMSVEEGANPVVPHDQRAHGKHGCIVALRRPGGLARRLPVRCRRAAQREAGMWPSAPRRKGLHPNRLQTGDEQVRRRLPLAEGRNREGTPSRGE